MDRKLDYTVEFSLIDRASSTAQQISRQLQLAGQEAQKAGKSAGLLGTQLSIASTAAVSGFRNATTAIEQMDESLRQISQTADNAADNISQLGNTAPRFNALNMSIQQVARELPAFAVSANTGFLAISNNLPILADAISNVRRENAALAAQGLSTVPVWRQVASSLLSWQTALVAGVTVLTLYGSDILNFVKNLVSLSDAADQNRKAMEALQSTNRNYNTELLQETTRLRDVYDRIMQTSEGTAARQSAIRELNETYGDYMPYLLSEKSSLEEIRTVYEALNSALQNHIALKVRSSEINKITEEAAKSQSEAIEDLQKALSEQQVSTSISDDIIASLVSDAPKWKEAGDTLREAFLQAVRNIQREYPTIQFNQDTRRGIQDYLESFYAMDTAVDAVNKRVDLLMGKTNQVKSIGEVVVVPDAKKEEEALNTNLQTIGGIQQKIQELQTAQNQASSEQAANLEREIRYWQEKLNLLQRNIAQQAAGNLANTQTPALTSEVPGVETPAPITIPLTIDETFIQKAHEDFRRATAILVEDAEISGRQISSMLAGGLSSLAAGFGEALVSGDGLEVFKSLLSSLMGMLQQFGSTLIAAGVAAQAFQSLLVAPPLAIVAGAALVTAASAAKAALQNVTAFADGGIVSGPTLALVGEYAGASSDPEVISPLSKLKSMIQPASEATEWNGTVRFEIEGDVLAGILNKRNRKLSRTR